MKSMSEFHLTHCEWHYIAFDENSLGCLMNGFRSYPMYLLHLPRSETKMDKTQVRRQHICVAKARIVFLCGIEFSVSYTTYCVLITTLIWPHSKEHWGNFNHI